MEGARSIERRARTINTSSGSSTMGPITTTRGTNGLANAVAATASEASELRDVAVKTSRFRCSRGRPNRRAATRAAANAVSCAPSSQVPS